MRGCECLSTTTSVAEAVRGAGVVIEAAPEKMDLKLALLTEVQAHAPADAVIASNTSALSITEMAAVLDRPGRMGGMHFFNPVQKMKLVEIVRALETSRRHRARDDRGGRGDGQGDGAHQGVAGLHHQPHQRDDRQRSLLHAAGRRRLGPRHRQGAQARASTTRWGPFELVDLVGLDTRLSILQYLHRTLGEKFRPCPLLEQHVAAGRLGRKVGHGVFDY